MSKKRRNDRLNPLYRPLVLATLMAGGVLQPLMPVLAAGVAAGTGISNTATATYKDDSNNPFNATSNTVTVTVAEIAGLLAEPAGVKDVDNGAVEAGDTLEYLFKVTNIGNTATDIHIPAPTTLNLTPTVLEYSIDNGANWLPLPLATGGIVPGVNPDQVVLVRVTGTVPTTGLKAGDDIAVTLGNTGPNDNSLATQNQPDTGAPGDNQAKDIRTQDANAITPLAGGEKEASAYQFVDFATQIKPLALATIKKTAASTPGTSQAGNDDVITYTLSLDVENTSPSGAFAPAALEGTDITLNGATANRILMSDVVPAGTVLTALPTAPVGWTTVYSTDDPASTVPVKSIAPGALTAANWKAAPLTAPDTLAMVKRVGFVKTGTILTTDPVVTANFSVVTSGLPGTGGKVYNVAQVFGQTVGDPTNEVVYDESGDDNPNNFNDNQTPPDATGSNFDPSKNTGVPNPNQDGTDPGNNTGTGPNGEDNTVDITGTVPVGQDDIFNGPVGNPNAVGPTDSNDDFSNVSAPVPAGQDPTDSFDPAPVSFSNSLSNPSTVAISNVTIEPISPSEAALASGLPISAYGANGDIPNGTEVTITYDPDGPGGVAPLTATYTYNATTGSFTINPGDKPVNVGILAPGASVNYTVTVDLPDTPGVTIPLADIPIPIIAFPDDDPIGSPGYNGADGLPGTTPELTNNVSIDRVYLGYMKLLKEARVLDAGGTVLENWTATPAREAEPGQFVEYRIRYENTSSQANGVGNVVLNANDFQIVEDGAAVIPGATPDNNWAANTMHQQKTTATNGSVTFYQNSTTVIGTTDPADDSVVGKYVNDVGAVAPGTQGSFQFRRAVK